MEIMTTCFRHPQVRHDLRNRACGFACEHPGFAGLCSPLHEPPWHIP